MHVAVPLLSGFWRVQIFALTTTRQTKALRLIHKGLSMKPHDNQNTPISNVSEVSAQLRVSYHTVLSLIKSGKLKATKVGREWRISQQAVNDLLRVEEKGETV